MRSQRQPFCELCVLVEGDPESDAQLRGLLMYDALANPAYHMDFQKFMATITGAGGPGSHLGGPGATTSVAGGGAVGGGQYY